MIEEPGLAWSMVVVMSTLGTPLLDPVPVTI